MTDKMTDKDQCNCRKPREDCSIHCELRLRLEKVLGSIEDAMINHGMTLEEVGGSTILFGFIKEVQKESHEKGRNEVLDKLEEKGHGGGNYKRLLIQLRK